MPDRLACSAGAVIAHRNIRVLAALRRFLRAGTPWRSLTATADQASGATLRRHLAGWAKTGLLARVHALLVGMRRGHPDLILDSGMVRQARRRPHWPKPDGPGQAGTKYHAAVDGDGVPVACAVTAANATTRSSSSACSSPPSPSWPASARCSPTKATMPSATAISLAALAPSRAFTSAASHMAQGWAHSAGRWSTAMPSLGEDDPHSNPQCKILLARPHQNPTSGGARFAIHVSNYVNTTVPRIRISVLC
ncbi:MAG: hypothetical protein JO266_18960 [Acidobacteria bacterium]|nr:hypothetical protein [Acidobacteriota bacterium]MBV9480022.1 hypothetical protein [Acidobacteriota bacterium]